MGKAKDALREKIVDLNIQVELLTSRNRELMDREKTMRSQLFANDEKLDQFDKLVDEMNALKSENEYLRERNKQLRLEIAVLQPMVYPSYPAQPQPLYESPWGTITAQDADWDGVFKLNTNPVPGSYITNVTPHDQHHM